MLSSLEASECKISIAVWKDKSISDVSDQCSNTSHKKTQTV